MADHVASIVGTRAADNSCGADIRMPNLRTGRTTHHGRSLPVVGEDDIPGIDYDARGRIDLSSLVDDELIAGADFYVCGPLPFMIEQKETLGRLGVEAVRIHTEVFGSGMLA